MTKPRFRAALLFFVLFLGVFLCGCSSESKPEDFVIEDGVVTKYTGKAKNVIVPDGVTAIGANVFLHKNIHSVIFPDSLTKIDSAAFEYSNVRAVVIPGNVMEIGQRAFCGCSKLVSVTLPDNGIRLERQSFANCLKLKEMEIPDSAEVLAYATDYVEPNHNITPSPIPIHPGGGINSMGDLTLCNMMFTGERELRLTFLQIMGSVLPAAFASDGSVVLSYDFSFEVTLRMNDGTELSCDRAEVIVDHERKEYRYLFYFTTDEKPKDVLVSGPEKSYELNARTFAEYQPWDRGGESGS